MTNYPTISVTSSTANSFRVNSVANSEAIFCCVASSAASFVLTLTIQQLILCFFSSANSAARPALNFAVSFWLILLILMLIMLLTLLSILLLVLIKSAAYFVANSAAKRVANSARSLKPVFERFLLRSIPEVRISKVHVRNIDWNAPQSRISDWESQEILANSELKMQHGSKCSHTNKLICIHFDEWHPLFD